MLSFDEQGQIADLNMDRARALLIGMFMSRGLITTVGRTVLYNMYYQRYMTHYSTG